MRFTVFCHQHEANAFIYLKVRLHLIEQKKQENGQTTKTEALMDKIYVHGLDGTDFYAPVNVREVNSCTYEILNDPEYEGGDESVLFEFYPGDIVEVEDTADPDDEYLYYAKRLIRPSTRQDRDYLAFKFQATRRHLPISLSTAALYKQVIDRIKKEKSAGQFFYRGIRETIDALDRLRK
jgi:hypothetical protein